MKTSTSIAALAAALAKAQGELAGAKKDARNPAFNSAYADLPSVIDALKATLPKHGLSYAQFPVTNEHGVGVETLLLHESGEFLQSDPWFIPVQKANAHGVGSALTYARRYSLAAVCGLKADDDDGNAAAEAAPKPAFHHPARQVAQDALEAFTPEQQAIIKEWAMEVTGLVGAGAVKDAVEFVEINCPEAEDKLALWALLDSRTRAAIKRAKGQAQERPSLAEQA